MKKAALLVGMAIAMLTAPASASATEWLHEGAPLEEAQGVALTGQITVANSVGSFACEIHLLATLSPGSTGSVYDEELTTNTCVGFGGYSTCKVTSDNHLKLPLPVHIVSKSIFTLVGFKYFFHLKCPGINDIDLEVEVPEIGLVPDDPEAISELSFSESGESNHGAVTVYGNLGISPAGTYGVG
jgi:hypothetical protein